MTKLRSALRVDLLDELYDVFVAMIATVSTAGIAAAQGTETKFPHYQE